MLYKDLLDMQHSHTADNDTRSLIDDYYNSTMCCIKTACSSSLGTKPVASHYEQYIITGWNDIVSQKHTAAREAFME